MIYGISLLAALKDRFWWFPHTFNHTPINAIKSTEEQLVKEMTTNKDFAEVGLYNSLLPYIPYLCSLMHTSKGFVKNPN